MKNASYKRLIELDRLIRLGRLKSAEQAASQFGVSRRTIERDLEGLRFELGARVIYNAKKKLYEYEGAAVTLPAQWLTRRELAIILIAERALRLYAGASFHREIHPVFNKLLEPVRQDKEAMDYIRELCASVEFERDAKVENVKNQFSRLLDAILEHNVVSITLITPLGRQEEGRLFEPRRLIHKVDKWYVKGWCRVAHGEKSYSLSNIASVCVTKKHFE